MFLQFSKREKNKVDEPSPPEPELTALEKELKLFMARAVPFYALYEVQRVLEKYRPNEVERYHSWLATNHRNKTLFGYTYCYWKDVAVAALQEAIESQRNQENAE